MFNFQRFIVILCVTMITACGGHSTVKQDTAASQTKPASSKGGGYYLDDGPGDNPPADIDSIPDAQLKTETPLLRPNKPYMALGKKYTPMTSYAPYVQQGVASWYGKRYHGKKTSSGEIYDMYGMSGAHTTLPIPSFVRVTNLENKRSVIVRINDRGPFKNDRLIDLSYAAAYKLRLIAKGSGLVQVEWIDTSPEALQKMNATKVATSTNTIEAAPVAYKETSLPTATAAGTTATATPAPENNIISYASGYYVQIGAFKNEANGNLLLNKILGLDLAGDAAVTNVYNDGIYRVKLGPFATRKEADVSANKVRKQLNISTIVTNQ